MKRDDLEAILPVVRDCARDAGALALEGFRKRPTIEHKGEVDLVTSFDRESEALIRERLSAAFAFDIVGEEHGGRWSTEAPAFFVDPIDGTTNFIHGHLFWCVSIGLAIRGVPTLGVVFAPSLGHEWYGFVSEEGDRVVERRSRVGLDGHEIDEPVAVSATSSIAHALLATGFPYDRRTSADNNFDAFVAIKKRCQAVRRCGAAALDLCMVADGTYDGYWERKLEPWDIAGGIALVRAAGGRVTDFDGATTEGAASMSTGVVVATNGALHDALLDELAKTRA